MSTENAFNQESEQYDDRFTNSFVGREQRKIVHKAMDELLSQSSRILEINCGTGKDWEILTGKGHEVASTDSSEGMINRALTTYPNGSFDVADMRDAHKILNNANFSCLFSNFGGLNCLDSMEIENMVEKISDNSTRGFLCAFVIMPKRNLMEDLYFLFSGKWGEIGRRKAGHLDVNVGESQVTTYYHAPQEIGQILERNDFQLLGSIPIGTAIPPSYLSPKLEGKKVLQRTILGLDRFLRKIPGSDCVSDHYLIAARKR